MSGWGWAGVRMGLVGFVIGVVCYAWFEGGLRLG